MWDIIGPLVGLDSGSLPWVLWGAGGAVGGLILFPSWSPTTCLFTQTRAPPRFKYTAGLGGARPTDGGMDKDFSMEMKFFFLKSMQILPRTPTTSQTQNQWLKSSAFPISTKLDVLQECSSRKSSVSRKHQFVPRDTPTRLLSQKLDFLSENWFIEPRI